MCEASLRPVMPPPKFPPYTRVGKFAACARGRARFLPVSAEISSLYESCFSRRICLTYLIIKMNVVNNLFISCLLFFISFPLFVYYSVIFILLRRLCFSCFLLFYSYSYVYSVTSPLFVPPLTFLSASVSRFQTVFI